ncbi:hypothetical protein FQN52_005583 [Onygenales sp. PD_12]|nr:hypothetical protein FQN52_005583 [Onygenales sp. PD_12]
MGRRDFVRDLQEASGAGKYPRMLNVQAGDDDGVIACTYGPEGGKPIDIQLLISELSDYPKEHEYFLYTTSDDVPKTVTDALEKAQSYLNGLTVSDMLFQIARVLENAASAYPSSDTDMPDADGSDDEYEWSPQTPKPMEPHVAPSAVKASPTNDIDPAILAKMADDLRVAKMAGFKVGYLGNRANPIICISCRISKLAISEEAMQAWQVNGNQYLVCLIRYIDKYISLEEIIQEDTTRGKASVEIHADLCDSYKPTLQSALMCFNRNPPKATGFHTERPSSANGPKPQRMIRSFISKPLNNLLNERFIKILRYRHTFGFHWNGAEIFFNDIQGKSLDHTDPSDPRYTSGEALASSSTTLPTLAISDHLIEHNGTGASFPLIVMQFVLRHFVRCTEFCLVCHCKTHDAFEALKPYVCSKSLCLYQYMALGFGPSLEWEIISQPYVVDLLISFTYASARQDRLHDFPTGLGFLVPPVSPCNEPAPKPTLAQSSAPSSPTAERHYAKFNSEKMELLFSSDSVLTPVRAGDWIVIFNHLANAQQYHCRVKDVSLFPTVQLGGMIPRWQPGSSPIKDAHPGYSDISFVVYNQNFDNLGLTEKRRTINMLLDTLPDVDQMKTFLTDTTDRPEPMLSDWRDSISKSALDVLRWIIASNRSCIIQDDRTAPSNSSYNDNDRVSGMDGYMQFRFAQGAPDKEQRFVQAVAKATERLNLKYPTLFAWHGSRLSNWHGILREGLHFKEALNGRAYGNGVYMSTQFTTSSSYMSGANTPWPGSKLKISSAISLNEVVNSPAEFVSKSPHFVVSQLDWIQPRYLFVNCQDSEWKPKKSEDKPTALCHSQDPAYVAKGPKGNSITIPVTAVSKGRRRGVSSESTPQSASVAAHATKPSKNIFTSLADGSFSLKDMVPGVGNSSARKASKTDKSGLDGYASDDTDAEDLAILADKQENKKGKAPMWQQSVPIVKKPEPPKTDFVPGTLSAETLPLLAQPTDATSGATKTLLRDFQATLKIQETHPAHELGWYVDPGITSTVYQWIVEFHSFDPQLPIASDLKKAGLKSIVLELRFPMDYPISPPFVRVIRPRFLNFMNGGGGHVTAGGALCMELLTNSGWSAVSSIESVLLQVRMAISSTDPKPARLQAGQSVAKGTVQSYGVDEAVDAYIRACRMHGWQVPKDFQNMRSGFMSASASSAGGRN